MFNKIIFIFNEKYFTFKEIYLYSIKYIYIQEDKYLYSIKYICVQ